MVDVLGNTMKEGYITVYPVQQYQYPYVTLVPLLPLQKCPGCKTVCSPSIHDFSLCTQLRNAEYRIRQLENRIAKIIIQGIEQEKSARQAAVGVVPFDERGLRQDYRVSKTTQDIQGTSGQARGNRPLP